MSSDFGQMTQMQSDGNLMIEKAKKQKIVFVYFFTAGNEFEKHFARTSQKCLLDKSCWNIDNLIWEWPELKNIVV